MTEIVKIGKTANFWINFSSAEPAETMCARRRPKFGAESVRTASESCTGLVEVVVFELFKAGAVFLSLFLVALRGKIEGAELGQGNERGVVLADLRQVEEQALVKLVHALSFEHLCLQREHGEHDFCFVGVL